jgi:hypothetical protein
VSTEEAARKLVDAVLDHGRITWSEEEEATVVTVDDSAVRDVVRDAVVEAVRESRQGDCAHVGTVYNERDETLHCALCGEWVLPEEET